MLVASVVLFNTSCFRKSFSVDRGSSQVIKVPFEVFHIATVLLELIFEGDMSSFLVGG